MLKSSLTTTLLLLFACLGAKGQKAEILTTDGSRTYDLTRSEVNIETSSNTQDAIVLKPNSENQSIDGYGFAITYSSCYNLMKMGKAERHALLKKTYSVGAGYGVSYARISIGCNDFSSTEYSLCDTRGLENFRLYTDEVNYVIPILKEILAINPKLKIIAAPWTCPKWMKVDNLTNKNPHNSWTDGHLNPDYYQDYASYFVKFIQAMKAEGINIYAVSPQNEPLNHGNCASLYMPWKEEAAFVKVLAQTFRSSQLSTKIYVFDHNYNYDGNSDQTDYPIKVYNELGNFEGSELVVGAAYHNYGGTPDELSDIHWQNTNKELIFTEASIGTWNNGRNLDSSLMDNMKNVAISTALGFCRAALVWNFMLDKNMGPNLDGGCQTCYGAIDIENDYSRYTLNSHYYIICHMSYAVRPGAKRIDTEGWWTNGLSYTAFKNPDGSLAIVFCNENYNALNVKVSDGSHLLTVNVPARSAVSCRFNNPTPTLNGQEMTYEKTGVYSYTGTLEQGKIYQAGGRTEMSDTDWFYDRDFFSRMGNGGYRFQAVTGNYKLIADFNQGCFRVFPVNNNEPATISNGGIWLIGGTGVSKPLYLWNGTNWQPDSEHAFALAQVSKDIYQISLTAGQQLNTNDVDFKFFGQAGWGTEFTPNGTDYKISFDNETFGLGDGNNGHDNGNIYHKSLLEYGKTYTFTLDCSQGYNHAGLSVNVPIMNGTVMNFEESEVYSYTGRLEQGKIYNFYGRSELTDPNWFYDSDFFEPLGGGNYRFLPLSGNYKLEADFNNHYFRIYPLDSSNEPATLADGGIWLIGNDGISKPSFSRIQGENWWTDTKHALALAQVSKDVYQITLTAGQQMNADNINFKFFGQAGWDIEFTSNGTSYKISTDDETFGIGDGSNGHDNGNIYKKSTLENGKSYTFILDCRDGYNNVRMFINDGTKSNLSFKALPDNMEDGIPYSYLRTFSSEKAWQKPTDVDVYVVERYENGKAYLKKIDFIPANTGVILGCNNNDYYLIEEYENSSASYEGNNLLVPTIESTLIGPSVKENGVIVKRNYMFGYHRNTTAEKFKLGFWRTAEGMSGENRAYLSLDANDSDAYTTSVDDSGWESQAYSRVVVLQFTESTGINAISNSQPSDCYFTLQGIQVTCPSQPGIYIHHGKKYIRK